MRDRAVVDDYDENVITYRKALVDYNWAAYNTTKTGTIGLAKCFCKSVFLEEGYTA